MHYKINKTDIDKIEIKNIEKGLTYNKVMELYKPDYLINLALYDTQSGINITKMKNKGINSGYLFSDYGLCFDDLIDFKTINNTKEFIGGSPTLIQGGKSFIDWGNKYSSYIDGTHKRSCIGFNDNEIILYNSEKSLNLDNTIKECIDLKMDYAINLDGGGSCHLQKGIEIKNKSLRSNTSWLLIYLKENKEEQKNMIIGLNAGHGISGSKSIGARTNLLCESTANRVVVADLKKILEDEGHIVVDCTIDYPDSASDCINKIVNKANSQNLDLFISIHFNAGANNLGGNGVTTGTEVYTYSATSSSSVTGKRIVDKIATLGFRNRGLKHSTSFGVLRSTKAPAILVECCFVDDKDDVDLYLKNPYDMAKKIAEGILNKTIQEKPIVVQPTIKDTVTMYGVKVHSFGTKEGAERIQQILKEVYGCYSEIYSFEMKK